MVPMTAKKPGEHCDKENHEEISLPPIKHNMDNGIPDKPVRHYHMMSLLLITYHVC